MNGKCEFVVRINDISKIWVFYYEKHSDPDEWLHFIYLFMSHKVSRFPKFE